MKISVIGSGPLGLSNGLVFSAIGKHHVNFVDHDDNVLRALKKGNLPFYEKGLHLLLKKSLKKKRLNFNTMANLDAKNIGQLSLVCVGTSKEGVTDLGSLKEVLQIISRRLELWERPHLVIIKSTLPPLSYEKVIFPLIKNNPYLKLILNPEFMREGQAISDLINDQRVLIGANKISKFNHKLITRLYSHLKSPKISVVHPTQAELIKYMSNSFFAALISLGNDWGRIAEHLPNTDVSQILNFFKNDPRIKENHCDFLNYLRPGVGFGGSCLAKDVQSFVNVGTGLGIVSPMLSSIVSSNNLATRNIIDLSYKIFNGNLAKKKICILGLSFKPQTSDTRSAVGVKLALEYLNIGAHVVCHDFKATMPAELSARGAKQVKNLSEAIKGTHLCILVNNGPQYLKLSEQKLLKLMKNHNFIDGRGLLSNKKFKKIKYFKTGSFFKLTPKTIKSKVKFSNKKSHENFLSENEYLVQ